MKIDESQFKGLAGKWTEVDMPMLEKVLGDDVEIIVGGRLQNAKPDSWTSPCRICSGMVALSPKDKQVMAEHPKIVVLCPTCFQVVQEE